MIDSSIGYILFLASKQVQNYMSLLLKEFDITLEQWHLLVKISDNNGCTQKELATITLKDQPAVTRALDVFVTKGWAERTPHPTDRRAFSIYITDKGRKLIEAILPVERAAMSAIVQGLSHGQIELLKENLWHIFRNTENLISELKEDSPQLSRR